MELLLEFNGLPPEANDIVHEWVQNIVEDARDFSAKSPFKYCTGIKMVESPKPMGEFNPIKETAYEFNPLKETKRTGTSAKIIEGILSEAGIAENIQVR